MTSPTISLCIPTHGRPHLLLEAIESGIDQTQLPSEILVSDDAASDEVKSLVETFARRAPIPVRYLRCAIAGQAENINNCFREAISDLILLLHDDDLLASTAIEALRRPFLENESVVASYGKQIVITNEGLEVPDETEALNKAYERRSEREGLQPDAFLSAIQQQFPNDGYLLKASVARRVWQSGKYGAACDMDFAVRCADEGAFFFVDEFTAKYRLSTDSVIRGKNALSGYDCAYQGMRLFFDLSEQAGPHQTVLNQKLREMAPAGVWGAIGSGRLDVATKWYFGPSHRHLILTPGGIRRGFLLLGVPLKNLFGRKDSR